MGDRLTHIHIADGIGSARDEHLVPGRGDQPCAELLEGLAATGFDGLVVVEINTRSARTGTEREADLAEALAFTRAPPRRPGAGRRRMTQPRGRGRPAGSRTGESGTRERILTAAREVFAERGYDKASVRSIAKAAEVDAALVHHYFGAKEQVFEAAVEAPPLAPALGVPDVLARSPQDVGERLARYFLSIWENPATRAPLLAVLRSAVTNETAAGRAARLRAAQAAAAGGRRAGPAAGQAARGDRRVADGRDRADALRAQGGADGVGHRGRDRRLRRPGAPALPDRTVREPSVLEGVSSSWSDRRRLGRIRRVGYLTDSRSVASCPS